MWCSAIPIETEKPQPFTIRIRVPEYWENPVFVLEGKTIAPVIENVYAVVAVSHAGMQTLTDTWKVAPR